MIEPDPGRPVLVASTEQIRAHFPALERRHEGNLVAYFDGPGGTQVPRSVVEAMVDYLYRHNANTHWAFPSSEETDRLISEARLAVADFLNADADEVAFGNNMTTLTFHLSRSLGRRLGPGDEVVVTELDHHANVDPWRAMARERGLKVQTVRMHPEDGQLDWDDLRAKLNDRTKILAIGAASNALGTITDVTRACRLAHEVGALTFVDAVHFAPHRLVDVRAIDCDFLACSAYKFHGPHAGLLYGKGELLRALDVPQTPAPSPDSAPEQVGNGYATNPRKRRRDRGIGGRHRLPGLARGRDQSPIPVGSDLPRFPRKSLGAGPPTLFGTRSDRRPDDLRAEADGTEDAHNLLCARWPSSHRRLPTTGVERDLRVPRRLLRVNGGRTDRPVGSGSHPRGMLFLLLDG